MPLGPEHLKFEQAFTEFPGQWVAVDWKSGKVVAARSNPYELTAFLRANPMPGVTVFRSPGLDEPEYVGIG